MITVYGIKNCDTVKKALAWLDSHSRPYHFHDYRKDGLSPELLSMLEGRLGWEVMVNRRGTTWRGLPDDTRANLNREKALQLMLSYPAIIKRPIIIRDDNVLLGFDAEAYANRL